ncbi:hypothetical protein MBLNU459_g0345t1 [Dothideomycetes sp. NU459]
MTNNINPITRAQTWASVAPGWVVQIIPGYRLAKDDLEQYLSNLFPGQGTFRAELREDDTFRMLLPRTLLPVKDDPTPTGRTPQPKTTVNGGIVETPIAFSFDDLQRLQAIEDKANEASLTMELFERQVELLECDLKGHTSRIAALLRIIADRKALYYGTLDYQSTLANRQASTKSQKSAEKMEDMTEEMHVLASKTQMEAISMRIITLVTLFYLPGTLISVNLSVHFVDQSNQKKGIMSTPIVGALNMGSAEAVWLFIKLTVPFTTATFLVWIVLHQYSKHHESAQSMQRRMHYIEHFMRNGLEDSKLPFDGPTPPYGFPGTKENTFYDAFRKEQQTFCAVEFEYRMDGCFNTDRLLPITCMNVIKDGYSATVRQFRIHPDYDFLHMKTSKVKQNEHLSDRTFVLKSYKTKHAKRFYDNEVQAFKRISQGRRDESLIQFLGSYTYHDDHHSIILEYADKGTLEDYFRTVQPPKDGAAILSFWRALSRVLLALHQIHEDGEEGSPVPSDYPFFRGVHQDIKPDNILAFSLNNHSPFQWTFKLADLGLSHFKQFSGSPDDVKDRDTQGTRTYGKLGPTPEVFLIDDSTSMKTHWPNVMSTVHVLGEMLTGKDPDDACGIQFIQYGHDTRGKERLEYLDSKQKMQLNRDIVDTVEFENGNIWKMLFGAVNRGLDDDEDDAEAIDPSAPALPFPS